MSIDLGGGVTLELVWIPPGTFMMGSPANEVGREEGVGHGAGKETQHAVTLTKGFWMGKYEITQAQWQRVMGNNPSDNKGAENPVEMVSWNDCQEFLKNLNAQIENQKSRIGNGQFRLPTEAEWEYACRAGTKTAYCFGNDPSDLHRYGNTARNRASAGGSPDGGRRTDLESRRRIQDYGAGRKYAKRLGPLRHARQCAVSGVRTGMGRTMRLGLRRIRRGLASGSYRVLRGGSWGDYAYRCRVAYRDGDTPAAATAT